MAAAERPTVICHMTSSIDGRLHPSRYTESPDGVVKDWSAAYEALHDTFGADAWLVGRVTMAEMAKGEPHPPAAHGPVDRSCHVAKADADAYAVALDRSGKVHFAKADIGGDHVVVLLGSEVSDAHLAELTADGISYVVSPGPDIDLAEALSVLKRRFGIETLLLEGGAGANGSFLAAGLVDELSVVVAPALDGGTDVQGIVAFDGGLKGKVRLALTGCERLDHGAVHLRYTVEAV
ncbi:dihydrofolate reductase family protein [Jiella sp. M17.18]|uniref:dihydrofolate reductase family protein n=1 Tax=Jiella sp. M17.18 TaxID=3234247 RepID=UPI0034DF227C